MPDSEYAYSPEHERLQEILDKVTAYQHSLSDDRAVELDELLREGALSAADAGFLTTHSVKYTPHRRSDYHSQDMFYMPTGTGCVFIGPAGRQPIKRRTALSKFEPIVVRFLQLPRPPDELLLHISLAERAGLAHAAMAVAPIMIAFTLEDANWRQKLPALRDVAAEFGFLPFQDAELQGGWILSFRITPDPVRTAAATIALLRHGCEFNDETIIVHSAGALDEAQRNSP